MAYPYNQQSTLDAYYRRRWEEGGRQFSSSGLLLNDAGRLDKDHDYRMGGLMPQSRDEVNNYLKANPDYNLTGGEGYYQVHTINAQRGTTVGAGDGRGVNPEAYAIPIYAKIQTPAATPQSPAAPESTPEHLQPTTPSKPSESSFDAPDFGYTTPLPTGGQATKASEQFEQDVAKGEYAPSLYEQWKANREASQGETDRNYDEPVKAFQGNSSSGQAQHAASHGTTQLEDENKDTDMRFAASSDFQEAMADILKTPYRSSFA